MNSNPNGRLAIYSNKNGVFYGKKIEHGLNDILRQEGEEEIKLKIPEVKIFPNSMLSINLSEGVRGEDAFLVQWFPKPAGVKETPYESPRNKEEFFHSIAALFQAGVKRLTLVMPYIYDQRKDTLEGRDTIGAALFCQELSGITQRERMQALCLDIHAQQIVGFYQLININLISVPTFKIYFDFLKQEYPGLLRDSCLILPDVGSSKRGRVYSELTGLPRIITDKIRLSPTKTEIQTFSLEGITIKGKTGLLIDDILGAGTTAGEAIKYLIEKEGLREAYWLITHPEITDLPKLDEMYNQGLFKKIFTADTIQLPEKEYFVQVPTSKLMARLIYNIHTDQSIGDYLRV
ncbi:ribose-phosphate pyrophosphokinase [Candidatus Woesearchaeota archaeon]|nr:ribose-phosphate pyrophosphokinase [Candidatus Woesearchaeota archaeon]